MNQEQLQALLASALGHLHISSPEEEQRLNKLHELMGNTLLDDEAGAISNQSFSFQSSDLFFAQNIAGQRLQKIDETVQRILAGRERNDLRVFVRDTPARTTQLPGARPGWAAGARLFDSIGPFLTREGRFIWFDFFRIEKLVALYIQGQAAPVMLFKASFLKRPWAINQTPESAKNYELVPGSVWIQAKLLKNTAPADRYCGIRVSGGSINLDAAPQIVSNKLVIGPANNIKCNFKMEAATLPVVVPTSFHGADARASKIALPATWEFSCNASSHNIKALDPIEWRMYGQQGISSWVGQQSLLYNSQLSRLLIPLQTEPSSFIVSECLSPFHTISGTAPVVQSWWGIAAAVIDINNPLETAGNGALILQTGKTLTGIHSGQDGNITTLNNAFFLLEPGRIGITDLTSDGSGASQELAMWKDDLNPHGTSVSLSYLKNAAYINNTLAGGDEVLVTTVNADIKTDRPVKVNGEPVEVRTKNSLLALATNANNNFIALYDDNIIWDHQLPGAAAPAIKPIALALENALFTVSPVNGCLLFGTCAEDWKKITHCKLLLSFGMFSYLPTLPDPYAANLGILLRQFGRDLNIRSDIASTGRRTMWLWLVCLIDAKPSTQEKDEVKVSFHFGNMPGDNSIRATTVSTAATTGSTVTNITSDSQPSLKRSAAAGLLHEDAVIEFKTAALHRGEALEGIPPTVMMAFKGHIPNYEVEWHERYGRLETDSFALLDVSSNANQMGISFLFFAVGRMGMMKTGLAVNADTVNAAATTSDFPMLVKDMSVYAPGFFVRAFTLPQIAWEPVFNLSEKIKALDPPPFFNYYPNDGGPTRIFNLNPLAVQLAPIPVVKRLIDDVKDPKQRTYALFTLPFGMKAIAHIFKEGTESINHDLNYNTPSFKNDFKGGIQIKATSGNFGKKFASEPSQNDSNMFPGYTIQYNNILSLAGIPNGTSTLGDSVSNIFNKVFWTYALVQKDAMKGVPLTRIDWSGYGSSTFSNWLSPNAMIAQVSQAQFNIMLGRTAHEVVQVKSIVYPWGIRVVRTITLFRTSSNYIYRVDSGWQAESDGIFDFRYKYLDTGNNEKGPITPYTLHPGVVRGLFSIKNIKEDDSIEDFERFNEIFSGQPYIVDGKEIIYNGAQGNPLKQQVLLRPVWFDADVEIENVVQGHHATQDREGIKTGKVGCKKILGYVQLAPSGVPITTSQFTQLLASQGNAIGANIDCQVSLHATNQQMRINRFDFAGSVDKSNAQIFVGSIRGNVLLPKDGSWSLVQHNAGTGDVTQLAESATVPVIRIGAWIAEKVVSKTEALNNLVRIANPSEILRDVANTTINFGLLQNTNTQKVLFLTPSFGNTINKLLSKTPPLYADAYRLMTGKGIFPNIGDAVTNYGKVISLLNGVDSLNNPVEAFKKNVLEDGGKKVWELLEIKAEKQGEAVLKQGMELLQKGANNALDKALKFDVPDFEVPLVDMEALRIYIEYKTGKNDAPPNSYVNSKLNFDIDSFSGDMAKTWKNRLNNVAMVVDLASIKRLMTIKGNFDARKGKEGAYEGQPDGATDGLPAPEIEFHKDLKPVIDLLEVLAQLSQGEYGEAMKKGLKIAMGNAGEIWEYKFEASKEIPLVRFPIPKAIYDAPTTPLKLEASMGLGVYFNAALKVTTDAKQLLPTAGAYLKFHGGLSVMCVSLAAATVYAKGTVDLKIAADTKVGPSLTMKFGFGAEIVVGLPVVGNVSVLYMIGVEIYIDSGTVRVSAILLFRGHAEIFGGLVAITITIEAKGTIEKTGNETNCMAQVTFAIDISIFLVINISFSKTWGEQRQIA